MADIKRQRDGPTTERLDFCDHRIGLGLPATIGDDEIRAGAREVEGDVAPEAARAARDECDFVFVFHDESEVRGVNRS